MMWKGIVGGVAKVASFLNDAGNAAQIATIGFFAVRSKFSKRAIELLTEITKDLKALKWEDVDIQRFADDLGTLPDVLQRFRSTGIDRLDYDTSKLLVFTKSVENSVSQLRRVEAHLTAVTQFKAQLSQFNGVSLSDLEGALAKADNKGDFLERLKKAMDDGDDMAVFLDKSGRFTSLFSKELLKNLDIDVSDTQIRNWVDQRKLSRQNYDNIKSTQNPNFQNDLKTQNTITSGFSENIAEAMADNYFAKHLKATQVTTLDLGSDF